MQEYLEEKAKGSNARKKGHDAEKGMVQNRGSSEWRGEGVHR